MTPDQLIADTAFEIIVANILSNTLVGVASTLLSHARSGTRIALSGILVDQITQVTEAYAHQVKFSEPVVRADWAMLSGTVV